MRDPGALDRLIDHLFDEGGHPHSSVRLQSHQIDMLQGVRAIASHPGTPANLNAYLAHHPRAHVALHALRNPNLPDEALHALLERLQRENAAVYELARQTRAEPGLLEVLHPLVPDDLVQHWIDREEDSATPWELFAAGYGTPELHRRTARTIEERHVLSPTRLHADALEILHDRFVAPTRNLLESDVLWTLFASPDTPSHVLESLAERLLQEYAPRPALEAQRETIHLRLARELIQHPRTPAGAAQRLGEATRTYEALLARNDTPRDVGLPALHRLYDRQARTRGNAIATVANSGPGWVADEVLQHPRSLFPHTIAAYANPRATRRLAHHANERDLLSYIPAVTPMRDDDAHDLSRHDSHHVRALVAEHAPQGSVLRHLAHDRDARVRAALARNPVLPLLMLEGLRSDAVANVQHAATIALREKRLPSLRYLN